MKKKNTLKNERNTMHDALVDTKTIAHKSASDTHDSEVVETLSEGSGGNVIAEEKRKKRKKEKRNKEDGQVDIASGVNQGDVSTIEEIENSKIDDANIRKRKKTKGHNCKDLTHGKSEKREIFR